MGTCVAVIWPAPDTSTTLLGKPGLGWFRALKFSQRNSTVFPSIIVNDLASARLSNASRGPRKEFRCTYPSRYRSCGGVKAVGLNHRFALGFETCGSPISSGRTLLKSAFRFAVFDTCTVNGMPE